MEKSKLSMLLIWVFLLVGLHGMEINNNCVIHEPKKGLLTILKESVTTQRNCECNCFQKSQIALWKCVFRCFCCINVDDCRENLLVSHDNLENQEDRNGVSQDQINYLKQALDDDAINTDEGNGNCLFCMKVFPGNALSSFVHTSELNIGAYKHFCLCYECSDEQGDFCNHMKICPICRCDVRPPPEECDYLKNAGKVRTLTRRKYDDNALMLMITSFGMMCMSIYLTEDFKGMGLMKRFMGEYNGETNKNDQFFTPFDFQQLARNMWGYYFVVSSKFVYDTTNAQSLVLDGRGAMYLVILGSTISLVKYDCGNYAAGLTILALIPFVADMFIFGSGLVASKRFERYNYRFPQLSCMETNYMKEHKSKLAKYGDIAATLFLAGDVFSSVVTFFNTCQGDIPQIVVDIVNGCLGASCAINSYGTYKCTPSGKGFTIFFALVNMIATAVAIFFKLKYDAAAEHRPVYTYQKLALYLFIGFTLMHAPAILNAFVWFNYIVIIIGVICLVVAICGNMGR